jgi:D-mannose binding lectin
MFSHFYQLKGFTMRRMIEVLMATLLLLLGSASAFAKDTLNLNESLVLDQYLQSTNGSYRFYLQGDGNLVLRNAASASLWSSATNGKGGVRLIMQGDGNLVLLNSASQAVWSSATNGKGATRATLQDNGNFALYTAANSVVWQTNTGSGTTPVPTGSISHIGSTSVWDANGQGVTVGKPANTRAGDLMVLVLHRTDDMLPHTVSGWTRRAACYKEDNGYQCLNVSDCSSNSGNFCTRFQDKYNGRDLAQVVFTRTAGSSEPGSYSFNLNQDSDGHPGWAILTTLRGANTTSPVRATANKGCDNDDDSLFPSVDGRKGDMLLLSQSFDDAVSRDKFGAPSGMTTFGYVSNSDEAGFLFGGILTQDGPTGVRRTNGSGASACKDALVSLTIKPL